jgi:hypothetical protein
MPLLLVSPLAKRNYVDHTLTDQSSVLRFIEDNWLSGERIQPGGSFDTIAGPLDNMFNFDDRDDEGRASWFSTRRRASWSRPPRATTAIDTMALLCCGGADSNSPQHLPRSVQNLGCFRKPRRGSPE